MLVLIGRAKFIVLIGLFGLMWLAQATAFASPSAFCDTVTEIPTGDCEALEALYNASGGSGWWTYSEWMSNNTPCSWGGVVCSAGRVSELNLGGILIQSDGSEYNATIPAEIGNLTALQVLDLSQAQNLTGDLPNELGLLTQLRVLDLSMTDELTGELDGTMLANLTQLETIDLSLNKLRGSLPAELGTISTLRHINLSYNHFSGYLPPEWGQLTQLQTLRLGSNGNDMTTSLLHERWLVGEIPASYGNMSSLQELSLCTNNFIGGLIPVELGQLSNLQTLSLCHNQFSGTIPAELGSLTNLTTLMLHGNGVSGMLPDTLGNLTNLTALSLYDNNVTGPLPASLISVPLNTFLYQNTQLCEPSDTAMQTWLASIGTRNGTGQSCDGFSLLMMIALAFDNRPTSAGNLQHHYRDTIDRLVVASAADSRKTIAVLVDLNNHDIGGRDHILIIQNGAIVSTLYGQPISSGTIDYGTAAEYNMTDGNMLGGFIKWAQTTYPATRTTFTYVGHGTFGVPNSDVTSLFPTPTTRSSTNTPTPLPWVIGTPDFTDENTDFGGTLSGLISPADLATAARIGTDNGANPLTVIDLVHCFAGSIEGLLEISADGESNTFPLFTEMFVTSPNYNYFDTAMLAAAVTALEPSSNAEAFASAMAAAYDGVLAVADSDDGDPNSVEHPRSIAAIDANVPRTVKVMMDGVAGQLQSEFSSDIAGTRAKLEAAYQNAVVYYDTTTCQPDYQLGAPDGLVDMHAFLKQIEVQFSGNSLLQFYLGFALTALDDGVVAHFSADGTPWFAPAGTHWTLTDANARGISFFADFDAEQIGSTYYRPWQAAYYNDSPEALRFARDTSYRSWADILKIYWDTRTLAEGTTTTTEACLPEFPTPQYEVELSVDQIIFPVTGTARIGQPTPVSAAISVASTALNPVVQFRVFDASNTQVFTSTVAAGYLFTGTHYIEAPDLWTPAAGTFRVEAVIDLDDRFVENDLDNIAAFTDTAVVGSNLNFSASLPNDSQWQTDSTLTLNVNAAVTLVDLFVQIYEYEDSPDHHRRIPKLTHQLPIVGALQPTATLTLPPTVDPGAITLHVWGSELSGNQYPTEMSIIHFNYAPPMEQINTDTDYFRLFVDNGDALEIDVTADVASLTLQIWEADMTWVPINITTSHNVTMMPAPKAQFTLAINGDSAGATYSADVRINGTRQTNAVAQSLSSNNDTPVRFNDPIPQAPQLSPTSIRLAALAADAPALVSTSAILPVILMLTLITAYTIFLYRDQEPTCVHPTEARR